MLCQNPNNKTVVEEITVEVELPWIPCCPCWLEYGGKLQKKKRQLHIMQPRKGNQDWEQARNSYRRALQFLCMTGHQTGKSWTEMTQRFPCKTPVLPHIAAFISVVCKFLCTTKPEFTLQLGAKGRLMASEPNTRLMNLTQYKNKWSNGTPAEPKAYA
jgi:hypothetical protein